MKSREKAEVERYVLQERSIAGALKVMENGKNVRLKYMRS